MSEIKFRAKALGGKWLYGSIIHITEVYCGEEDIRECDLWNMITEDGAEFETEKETIGQFTGLYDKNGKEIYEGDILNFDDEYWVVSFEGGKFIGTFDNMIYDIYEISHYEVVGNIYENSDLLGE